MKKNCLFLSVKTLLFIFCILLQNLSLTASNETGAPDEFVDSDELIVPANRQDIDLSFEKLYALKKKNIQRAKALIEKLYTESSLKFAGLSNGESEQHKVGTQAGYYGKEGTAQAVSPLVLYRRVWIYDAGIALSLAIENKDSTVDARALWLLKKAQYTRDPQNPEEPVFAGWAFSSNQRAYGDNWTDCRFITGANAYALLAIAKYIVSDYYLNLSDDLRAEYLKFYAIALTGILYHMELDGPNEGLITAGWSLNVLEEFSKTNYSYNRILDMVGYGPTAIDGYPDPVKRVRSRNIVTEHCNNVLAVLNYTLKYYDLLFENKAPYTYSELDEIRRKLRNSIYSKLYDKEKRRFITGRSPAGDVIPYSAVDNTSWFSLSLRLEELSKKQVEKLSDSFVYTINTFAKDFTIGNKTYFGCHYFEDGYEDPYIGKSESHSKALHVEATCSLISGLYRFADAYPEDVNTPLFLSMASRLWENMQYFVYDHGFVYASTSLQDVNEPIEASVSAIWYLRTCNYVEDIFDRIKQKYGH